MWWIYFPSMVVHCFCIFYLVIEPDSVWAHIALTVTNYIIIGFGVGGYYLYLYPRMKQSVRSYRQGHKDDDYLYVENTYIRISCTIKIFLLRVKILYLRFIRFMRGG